jgi:uncharacterized protein
MLYLDASALIKRYVQEDGTAEMETKLQSEESAGRPVFTSALTFAEIHAALARRTRDKSLSVREFNAARKQFEADWVIGLSSVNLDSHILLFIPSIVKSFYLKGADAVHLATALWLRDFSKLTSKLSSKGAGIVFAASDKQLLRAAKLSRMDIFDPQSVN